MPSDQPEKSKRDDVKNPRDDKAQGDKETVRPVGEKIREGDGNLRRRADWFQKRSGQKE